MREKELEQVTPRLQPSLTAPYKAVLIQEEPSTFFDTSIRRYASRSITLRRAAALWAGPPTQFHAFLSRVTIREKEG
jgi:hypothetical protein